jgi:hypothetical protein
MPRKSTGRYVIELRAAFDAEFRRQLAAMVDPGAPGKPQ